MFFGGFFLMGYLGGLTMLWRSVWAKPASQLPERAHTRETVLVHGSSAWVGGSIDGNLSHLSVVSEPHSIRHVALTPIASVRTIYGSPSFANLTVSRAR